MRLLLLSFLSLFLVLSGQAQERVRNIRVRAADSAQVEIQYDLIYTQPGDSVYFEMQSRARGALQIRPEFVRGDFGKTVTVGKDRRILWNAVANGYSLNEDVQAKVLVKAGAATVAPSASPTPTLAQTPTVSSRPDSVPARPAAPRSEAVAETNPKLSEPVAVTLTPERTRRNRRNAQTPIVDKADATPVDVKAEPVPNAVVADTTRRPKTRYAGPAWALLSAVAPGIGNIFVQTPKPKIGIRPLLAVGCYGLFLYGLSERQKAQDVYAVYEQQKNRTQGEPYYQTANDHHHAYFLATRGAVLVAATDVVLTFIRGLRNNRIQKEARRIQGVAIRPGLQAGEPTAVLRYSF